MFAGPNGSGKTTIKNGLNRPAAWFGIYLNPDDLEKSIKESGGVSIAKFDLDIESNELRDFFVDSTFLTSRKLEISPNSIQYSDGRVEFTNLVMNSYYVSVLADFLRRKAIEQSKSFSFETVMSAADKVELLHEAQQSGFRTYLYYVATDDPIINIDRIKNRVAEGGHDVPRDKIVARYYRSLALLPEAIRFSDRTFLFDSSGIECRYFAEVTDGRELETKSDEIPNWFRPVWEKF